MPYCPFVKTFSLVYSCSVPLWHRNVWNHRKPFAKLSHFVTVEGISPASIWHGWNFTEEQLCLKIYHTHFAKQVNLYIRIVPLNTWIFNSLWSGFIIQALNSHCSGKCYLFCCEKFAGDFEQVNSHCWCHRG